jgi:hypothetical protein
MKRALAAVVLSLAASCVAAPYPDIVARQGTAVALGQRAHVGRYVVRPISVYEDSRCPAGVRCIFAGRVILYALLDGPEVHENRYLTLGVPSPVGNSSITLTDVRPQRFAQVPLRPADYRFVFAGGS